MLRTSDLDYHLPPELIATVPASPRDSARLLVVSRSDAARIEHRVIRDLPSLLSPRDLIVTNSTRVVPAYLSMRRTETGGQVTGLFLRGERGAAGENSNIPARRWIVMLKGGHLHPGVNLTIERPDGAPSGVMIRLESRIDLEPGAWLVSLHGSLADSPDAAILDAVGATPIPPYIRAARKASGVRIADDIDRAAYQTVFAHADDLAPDAGSVAAPTAGLHFTPDLLASLHARGVERAEVSLHVGSGTFKPVETEFVEQHPIHAEWCIVPAPAWKAINETRSREGRIICVGTTAARTVESFAGLAASTQSETLAAQPDAWLSTRLLITPGYEWRVSNGLLTNFHLPRSSLMALVAAMLPSGAEHLQRIYAYAIRERYRFYSYGDAMLILP